MHALVRNLRSMRLSLLVSLCLFGAWAWWQSPLSLRVRVAVQLLGWDGLLDVAKASVAQRVLGVRATASRRAFHEALEALARADTEYLVPQRRVVDDLTIAEGHRLLSHLVQAGLRIFLEADLDRPHFTEMVSPFGKVLGDNPDAFYYTALVRQDGPGYVIHGRGTGEDYLSFTVYEASCLGCFSQKIVADLNDRQIAFEPDGSFTILVSKKKDPQYKNWLSLASCTPSSFPQIITRHYFERELSVQLNVTARVQDLRITNLQPQPRYPGRLSDEQSAERWGRIAEFVTSHTLGMQQDPSKAPKWFSFTPNTFGPPTMFRAENSGEVGAVDIAYSAAPFKFSDVERQGLLITGRMPKCAFANVALWNVFLQTLSYERGNPVSLNRKQLKSLDKQTGRFRIILSKDKPTAKALQDADWLFSEGRTDGTLFFRFLLPEEDVEQPKAELVDVKA